MKKLNLILLLLMGLFLMRCADVQVTAPPVREKTSENVPVAITPQLKAQGLEFEKFIKRKLSAAESSRLVKNCTEKPDENPFCFSIVNQGILEANARKPLVPNRRPARRHQRTRIRISHGEVKNWEEVRSAPINSLLRAMRSLSPAELRKLNEVSRAEETCPNNVAIALAATLEDDLPEKISPQELAELYHKGASCPMELAADQETLLCRAGLFYFLNQNFSSAEKSLAKAAALEKTYTGRSLYWLYRSRLALKDKEGAQLALDQLRNKYPFSFHTLVGLSANNVNPGEVLKRNVATGNRRSQKPGVNRLIEQVELLRRMEQPELAAHVLKWAIAESREAEPEVRLYLAELKDDSQDYRIKISLLSEVLYNYPSLVAKETMELYFPKVHFPVFEKNSSGLDPYFLISVARQESAFNIRAVSSAKAKGLLQVIPQTGRRFWDKKRMDLNDPDTNVQIGARYLQELLRKTNGQVHYALAAYNAGENRLATWESRYQTTEPVLFIDLIPFRETREYVASILRNYFWYRRIHAEPESELDKAVFDMNLSAIFHQIQPSVVKK